MLSRVYRQRGQLQAAILDAVKSSRPERPPSDDEIAVSVGLDRSMCSLWRSGERVMGVKILQELSALYGMTVLCPLIGEGYLLMPQVHGRLTAPRRGIEELSLKLAEIQMRVMRSDLTRVPADLLSLVQQILELYPSVRRKS